MPAAGRGGERVSAMLAAGSRQDVHGRTQTHTHIDGRSCLWDAGGGVGARRAAGRAGKREGGWRAGVAGALANVSEERV
jgi:hypothetical protein